MERRQPERVPQTAEELAAKQQETRVLQMAKQYGYSIHKVEGPLLGSNKGYYQLIEWNRNLIVMGENFDASLDQIETYLSQTNRQ